jgi:hypothetical protein
MHPVVGKQPEQHGNRGSLTFVAAQQPDGRPGRHAEIQAIHRALIAAAFG